MSNIFGWSYPPGCAGPPEPQDLPEECPTCGGPNSVDAGATDEWKVPELAPYCSQECFDKKPPEEPERDWPWDDSESKPLEEVTESAQTQCEHHPIGPHEEATCTKAPGHEGWHSNGQLKWC